MINVDELTTSMVLLGFTARGSYSPSIVMVYQRHLNEPAESYYLCTNTLLNRSEWTGLNIESEGEIYKDNESFLNYIAERDT